jgi:hypothetical protein
MKKMFLIMLCITIAFIAAGCTPAGDQAQEPHESTTGENTETGLPNPMVEVDTPNFDEKLGFSINNWPSAYAYERIYVIADAVSEINFIVDGNALSFRTAKESEGEISGVYDPFDTSVIEELAGIQVTIAYTQDQTGLATWIKDGYTFSLYIKSGASAENLSQIAESIINSISIGSYIAS